VFLTGSVACSLPTVCTRRGQGLTLKHHSVLRLP
jgi:hypothetical protein